MNSRGEIYQQTLQNGTISSKWWLKRRTRGVYSWISALSSSICVLLTRARKNQNPRAGDWQFKKLRRTISSSSYKQAEHF